MGNFSLGIKVYSESTMMGWTKRELVEYARCCLVNLEAIEETYEQHMENVKDWGPIKKGRWIDSEPGLHDLDYRKSGMSYYCSSCGHRAGKDKHKTYKFCPWCGADMRGENNECTDQRL